MEEVAIICDIDNCFTDSREWMADLPAGNDREEWDNVIRNCGTMVVPNYPFINIIKVMSKETTILFMTGREDRLNHREVTLKQLKDFSGGALVFEGEGQNAILMMRKELDYREASAVKKEMLDSVIKEGFSPLLAIDDEPSNCEMFCENGVPAILYNINEGSPADKILDCLSEIKEECLEDCVNKF